MKRGGPLTRRTRMVRSTMARSRMSATPPPPLDWRPALAKVAAEGACRVCGRFPGDAYPGHTSLWLEAAHVISRAHHRGLVVQAAHVVPLCGECHRGPKGYDQHALNLRPYLTEVEWAAAVELVGEGPAERRTMGGAWRSAA